jgi:enoyl-CoA hydratase/carnithine racemase
MMDLIEVQQEGPVRTVTLNRPEKSNALTSDMLIRFHEAFQTEPDAQERVTVIRSTGRVFSAGRDLREQTEGGRRIDVEPIFHAIETYPLPVIAVVQGAAIAGGCEMALHCDFVVASERASFGMSLAQIGLAPSWFLAKKLLEVAGPVGAREILLLGEPLSAEHMHRLGMIARVAPPEQLEQTAQTLIDRLIANAPLSLRAIKALLVREMAFRDGIAHDDIDALVLRARTSEDAMEGMRARMEKREANFRGQ